MKNSYLTATDQFCGAGGSSSGAVAAGVEVKLALNHWKLAVETHSTNFRDTMHDCTDISASDPRRYPSTDILITSPECTNHSLAKGKARKYQQQLDLFGKVTIDPAEERSRATMWDVPRFAEYHEYRIIIVENVVDARYWATWDAWLHAMDLLGYNHQVVYFNSMFAYPTPQSRDRMYVVFWRKGNRKPDLDFRPPAHCAKCERTVEAVQAWKKQRWGRYKKQYIYVCPVCQSAVEPYYYCAANAIDWSLPAVRIGERSKPLKEKTLKRIQSGLEKFGRQPVLVDTIHSARNGRDGDMTWSAMVANRTQIGQATQGLIMPPFVADLAHNRALNTRCFSATETMPTQTSYQTMALVTPPYMIDLRGSNAPRAMTEALSTVCASGNHHGVVTPFIASYYGTDALSTMTEAVPTVVTIDKHALVVPPFLLSYYTRDSGQGAALASMTETLPTQPTWPVHYLVQPGDVPDVEECGFRMLQPHEIQKAMAFADDYVVLGNAREKVKQLGNAVTPPVMRLLVDRCVASLQ
ncbi:MAG: DNA cytosine methyltransferase [Nitrospiraceae bacterium]